MPPSQHPERVPVVVVGGGIAALEAVLALHELAAERVAVTLIAPEPAFALRPLDAVSPPACGYAGRLDLERFMDDHDGTFRRGAMRDIDPEAQEVHCSSGPAEPYDVLVVAVGATTYPVFEHVLTFGTDPLEIGHLLRDLEGGDTPAVAFVVPVGCTWPLPIYELALAAADEAARAGSAGAHLHLVTPEDAPLDLFGAHASRTTVDLLDDAAIHLHLGVAATVPRVGHVDTGGAGFDVQRIIAMPQVSGSRVEGLPADALGYLPVDEHGRVPGAPGVFAAGDASGHRIKQGGLACREADAVASQIAADAGASAPAVAYDPVLRGRLLTVHGSRLPVDRTSGVRTPLWLPPLKDAGRRLAPYLHAQGLVELPTRDERRDARIDVLMPAA